MYIFKLICQPYDSSRFVVSEYVSCSDAINTMNELADAIASETGWSIQYHTAKRAPLDSNPVISRVSLMDDNRAHIHFFVTEVRG